MINSGKHFHVVIWAADGKTETGYSNVTYVEVIAKTVSEAIERVKQLVPNKMFYHVNNIIEHHGHEESK